MGIKFKRRLVSVALLSFALLGPAQAIIVGGISGTGNNNDGEASLDDYISTSGLPSFDYWDNLVQVSNASGVYLGYNETTMTGWVLSANHISPEPTSITIAGTTYSVIGTGTQIAGTDLILYEIGGAGDPVLPTIPAVSLASTSATTGEFLLMTGRGFTTTSTYPYSWGDPGTNPDNGFRWGTNVVEFNATLDGAQYVITDFDDPSSPQATEYEGQGSLGDSGGGLFVLRDGEWILAGIAYFVDDGPSDDGTTNPSEYGDYTGYTDVAAYASQITAITGTLVPEPSTALLLPLAAMAAFFRRRRD
ncbi:PEP-CTERM sorting domain-containing protein [Luteolibacter pohnpeiensis]|uniref:PEP-CTERM sorting domain-containing protein n=1 Tax=Luteolibacter pohnpeiensis TaxID=454153 RepID=A0A934S8X7_9BACT|nr:PEP-CTERM sorting domain-containing protein [Luteolibacter pohnpeiensis]MBK1884327.1 PEP-CTERM sorting domain-containing protein [Luteolibacter pohnpeiensis]